MSAFEGLEPEGLTVAEENVERSETPEPPPDSPSTAETGFGAGFGKDSGQEEQRIAQRLSTETYVHPVLSTSRIESFQTAQGAVSL